MLFFRIMLRSVLEQLFEDQNVNRDIIKTSQYLFRQDKSSTAHGIYA